MPWFSNLIWLCAIAVLGTFLAAGSAYMQRAGLSPVVLSSAVIGAVFGMVAVWTARWIEVRNARVLMLGTLAGAVFVATMQHGILHRLHAHDWAQAQIKQPQLALFRDPPPDDLWQYLRQESAGGRFWLWLLDGGLIAGTATAVVAGVQNCSRQTNMRSG